MHSLKIQNTSDGSVTFFSEKFGQTYHSVHGAQTESERVFIELGFEYAAQNFDTITLLEVGFGTGLNAFLTLKKAEALTVNTNYYGIEAYPLSENEYRLLPEEIQALHRLNWDEPHTITPFFSVFKSKVLLQDFEYSQTFNLIYFDAFSPEAQPELWSEEVFRKMYGLLDKNGVLTTYCSKSWVQKNMKAAGFTVEKHPGPPHKREIIRAIKNE